MKKILIWKCRKCGVEANSLIPQDEEKYPENKRFFTCNECIIREWNAAKEEKAKQAPLF